MVDAAVCTPWRCRLRRALGVAAVLALAMPPAFAAATADYIRESRWAQEVTAGLVVGDAVYLATPLRPRVLALLTEPEGAGKGGVVIVHGLGLHPDWGLIGGLRTGLADAGYTTLSVQMPVLAADAPRSGYPATFAEAGDRIVAAIGFLKARGVVRIAVVAHSLGAVMADAYLARGDAIAPDAFVPIGMPAGFTVPPRLPVLDIVAGNDLPEVKAAAPGRRTLAGGDACRRALVVAGSDHFFRRGEKELVAAVAAFLEPVFAGRCPPPLPGDGR